MAHTPDVHPRSTGGGKLTHYRRGSDPGLTAYIFLPSLRFARAFIQYAFEPM